MSILSIVDFLVYVNFTKMSINNIRLKNTSNSTTTCATGAFDVKWDIDKYRDEHECEEHWQLRKAFMEKWKNNFSEERLICLARVFTNIEFMGCRYPAPVMQEIAQLAAEVGKEYREQKKTKLQRTFVSASDAAEDRAKGVKRVGGEIIEDKPKSAKIAFVAQGQAPEDKTGDKNDISDEEGQRNEVIDGDNDTESTVNKSELATTSNEKKNQDLMDANEYIQEMSSIDCLNIRNFREDMFRSTFGPMVLLIRPWARKLWNIQTSCQVCGINLTNEYKDREYSLCINGIPLARAQGDSRVEARNAVENIAWETLRRQVISVLVKEQFIAQGDARISVSDVSGKKDDMFGTPVENSVAMKMMKMMGWKGGGLGADAQGIAEPIKPNLQMVNRAGLGSAQDMRMLRRAAQDLMQRYITSDAFDLDLVFASDFSKQERATLHGCAQKIGLASRSYGEGEDRFLVVKKKLDPFSLTRAIISRGGITPKYQVFIPAALAQNRR